MYFLVSATVTHHYSQQDQQGAILQGYKSRESRKNTTTKLSYSVSNLIVLDCFKFFLNCFFLNFFKRQSNYFHYRTTLKTKEYKK